MNNDREYIKEMFDSDGIKAPESLSEESMLAMVNASGWKKSRRKSRLSIIMKRSRPRHALL